MRTEHAAIPDLETLYISGAGHDRQLRAGSVYRIGRDPQADIVLTDPRVSWQHATIEHSEDGWLLLDTGSTNGTFQGRKRVTRLPISSSCELRLGHPDDGPALSCRLTQSEPGQAVSAHPSAAAPPAAAPPAAAPPAAPARAPLLSASGRSPSRIRSAPLRRMRIGRAPDNDAVVSDLSVSRYHAELCRTRRGGYEILDLDSYNGTYLNGQRITAAPVTELDQIGIGPATFRLVGDHLQEFIDTGDIKLAASELTVRIAGNKVLLDRVSFPLGERCMLGVIGPSGAGKSTLLGAVTGTSPATQGQVLYDGRDLYRHYAELRHRIGLVPQENILHTQLTARRALRYAAELRFPRDTSKSERERRIDEVLAELSLTAQADTRTSALSGGQQKRVNVALELLTKPSLLFLDEPTSGLDPGLDKSVMEMLVGLAHDGRTVVVVTHSVANLGLCDRLLVLVPGGKVAFFGPPADGLKHFGKPGWAEVFQAFEAEPRRDWAGEFRRSAYHNRYVTAEMNSAPPVAVRAVRTLRPARARNRVGQLSTLTRRFLSVIASDRTYLAALAALPLLLGGLVRAIPSANGLQGPADVGAQSVLLVLAVGATFSGAANAIWEIIKERSIYGRERAVGLSAGAYLLSKMLVLGVISAVQAVLLVAVGLIGRPLPRQGALLTGLPLPELLLAVAAMGVASMALALLISSLINSSEKALPLLVGVVMVQVVLSGGIFPLHGKAVLEQLSWLSPSHWGYSATASTADLSKILPPAMPGFSTSSADPLWDHTARAWLTDVAMLLLLTLVFGVLTWRRLARMRPLRRR
ncbi:MAG: FHA domain-containing protein [Actinobacteria bacterium]|nr:FHA domain-containing protein [Actinomycetota bacterium]